MKPNKIAFISTRSRGLSPDLRITKDYLMENIDGLDFRYFTSNENIENRMVKKGVKSAKKDFCKDIRDVICIDGSLPVKLDETAVEGNKILISTPYEYQFRAMNTVNGKLEISKKKTFNSFTHVITGSEFGRELFEHYYKLSDSAKVYNICAPLAWDINQKHRIQQKLEKYSFYFPNMKGKKIFSIVINGKIGSDEKNPFEGFDWKSFFETLGEDWFVFTNSEDVMENLVHLGAEYCVSFGYVNRMLDARELLYFSDVLVTNSGMYASYFSSKRKPVYCVSCKDNAFEQYMKKNYSSLFIEDFNDMVEIDVNKYDAESEKFSKYFSYDISVNPCEEIAKILND